MTTAGFLVPYTIEALGDGVTTVYKVKLTKSNIIGPLTKGGVDLGLPIDIFAATLPAGVTASLSGLDLTITFATPLSAGGAENVTIGVIYG